MSSNTVRYSAKDRERILTALGKLSWALAVAQPTGDQIGGQDASLRKLTEIRRYLQSSEGWIMGPDLDDPQPAGSRP